MLLGRDFGGMARTLETLIRPAMPLLQIGTITWVAGFLLWVEPAIALLAVVVYFPDFWVRFEELITILFIFLTVPVSSHLISRAAYFLEESMVKKNNVDELDRMDDIDKDYLKCLKTLRPE